MGVIVLQLSLNATHVTRRCICAAIFFRSPQRAAAWRSAKVQGSVRAQPQPLEQTAEAVTLCDDLDYLKAFGAHAIP